MPESLTEIALSKRDLILFVGGTSLGKSTTLASLTDHRNYNHTGHIITIEAPIEFVYPHKQLFLDISLNIRGIVSQRLIPAVDGQRAAAVEILRDPPRVKDLIRDGKNGSLKEAMDVGDQYGMQTFD